MTVWFDWVNDNDKLFYFHLKALRLATGSSIFEQAKDSRTRKKG
jgi:hypothetical protein